MRGDKHMNVVICDDDEKDIDRIAELLKKYGLEHTVHFDVNSYKSGEELLSDLLKGSIADIYFLDINMDGIDGIEVARRIRERYDDVPIVFITAYINYALDGYKVRANRFLVKDDLEQTLPECIDDLCRMISRKAKNMVFRCVDGEYHINLSEVVLFETSGRQLIIYKGKQRYQMYEKMDDLEEKLAIYGFIRIHRCYLVNTRHIANINNYVLTLDDGRKLPIPKGRYKDVKQKYTLYMGAII